LAILTLPNTITANTPAVAESLQENFESINAVVNGQIDSFNISKDGVATDNYAPLSITTPKLANGVDGVTLSKMAPSLSIGSKALTDNVTIAASKLADQSWQDVTGLVLPAYNPAVNSRALFSGVLHVSLESGADDYVFVGVLNGSVVCFQAMYFPSSGHYVPVPLSGYYDMTANTTYTFKVCIKTSLTSNTRDVTVLSSDGRAQFSASAVPR